MKLINELRRETLEEGRRNHMAFGFVKRTGDELTTIQPVSPCKDYLNDIVFTEFTGTPMSAYGLRTSHQGLLDDDKLYLILTFENGSYSFISNEYEEFNKNLTNSQEFIRNFEKELGISELCTLEALDDKYFLFTFSKEWLVGLYCISMLSLLLRISQWYDGIMPIREYVDTFKHFKDDVYLVNGSKKNIFKVLDMKSLPKEDFAKFGIGGMNVHNYGIMSVNLDNLSQEVPEEDNDDYDDNYDD